jgi:hypothetical protein
VTTTKRLTTPALAKLPTLDESGLKGFNVSIWHGLYAPKGTPKAVVDKVNTALKRCAEGPRVHQAPGGAGRRGGDRRRVGPAEHKKFVEAEIAKWGPAIKAAGQYADPDEAPAARSPRGGRPSGPAKPVPRRLLALQRPFGAVVVQAMLQRDRHRPVVDQVHLHVGAECRPAPRDGARAPGAAPVS